LQRLVRLRPRATRIIRITDITITGTATVTADEIRLRFRHARP